MKLTLLMILINLLIPLGVPLTINVCSIVADGGIMPYGVFRSGPALELGLEALKTKIPPDVVVNHFVETTTFGCTAERTGALAAEMYFLHNASVFIGPACSFGVDVVGRMAKSWNLPVITPVGTDAALGDKSQFPTLTRLTYNNEKLAKFYLNVFHKFNWTDISVLYDDVFVLYKLIGPGMHEEFIKAGIRSTLLDFNTVKGDDLRSILRTASTTARVFVISCSGDTLRRLLLIARSLGMTNGEYAFIFFRLFKGEGIGDYSWVRGDGLDNAAKEAYQSLLIITLRRPTETDFQAFELEVKERSLNKYSYDYGDFEVNPFVTAFHDAFVMYGEVLNETLARGKDPLDGYQLTRQMWNRTFVGVSGRVRIDSNGDRETDLTILDMEPGSGLYQVVGYFFGADGEFLFSPNVSIHWPNNGGPPANEPRCGFTGDAPECQHKEFPTIAIVIIAFSGVLLLVAVVSFITYRKLRHEADLQSNWWKIDWNDIVINKFRSKVSLKVSDSKLPVDVGSFSSNVKDRISAPIASYNGANVVLHRLNIRSLQTTRRTLVELKRLREFTCNNLTKFIGLTLHHEAVFIVLEYCTRGTLQDILQNESINLDWDFRLSLISDVVQGLTYLHESPIHTHGRLNSQNCVIDSRFVLKLTDFGIPHIRKQEISKTDENIRVNLWKAPEVLRRSIKDTSVFYDEQMADIYSFGIILYEIMERKDPFEDDLEHLTVSEVIRQVKNLQDPPFRPRIEGCTTINKGLIRIMKKCWDENPKVRPTIHQAKREIAELGGNTSADNFLDKLLRRMEQYANNLEEIVEQRTEAFLEEKKRAEQLLYQVLPKSVADELKHSRAVDPEAYECVTIYFSDIVGFTSISAISTPFQVVDLLNDLYTCFDSIIENFDVYKVETIGDAYMVVSGLPVRNGSGHVLHICRMSLSILDSVRSFKIRHLPDQVLKARIGVHSGPVCAGVVGRKMPRYCLFGDTVNTASRMESNGEAMKIHVSCTTNSLLQQSGIFKTQERGKIPIKGKGDMTTYWLLGETRDSQMESARKNESFS